MITLNIDIKTDKPDFDPDNIVDTIEQLKFNEADEVALFVTTKIAIEEDIYTKDRVYVLAYGGDEDGIVLVDHDDFNIVQNISTQFKENLNYNEGGSNSNIFLFACKDYNEAYELALDMKEQTGMLKWQLEYNDEKEYPTVGNGGIDITSLAN